MEPKFILGVFLTYLKSSKNGKM